MTKEQGFMMAGKTGKETLLCPVKITDLETDESYIANSLLDCKDSTDRSGYNECVSSNDVITMGKIIFQPKWTFNK